MEIIDKPIGKSRLMGMQEHYFGDMVKGVVDVEKGLLALDAELHADLEQVLLEHGSSQKDLWGINFYPETEGDDFLEFDSLINIRPSQGNRSRGIEDAAIRKKIVDLVDSLIKA